MLTGRPRSDGSVLHGRTWRAPVGTMTSGPSPAAAGDRGEQKRCRVAWRIRPARPGPRPARPAIRVRRRAGARRIAPHRARSAPDAVGPREVRTGRRPVPPTTTAYKHRSTSTSSTRARSPSPCTSSATDNERVNAEARPLHRPHQPIDRGLEGDLPPPQRRDVDTGQRGRLDLGCQPAQLGQIAEDGGIVGRWSRGQLQRTGTEPLGPGQHLGGRAVGDGQPEPEVGQLGPVAGGPGPKLGRAHGGPVGVDDPEPGPQGGAHTPTVAVELAQESDGVPRPDPHRCRAGPPHPGRLFELGPGDTTAAQIDGDLAGHQPDLGGGVGPARPVQRGGRVRAESSSRLDRSPRSPGPARRSTRPGPPTGSIARAERRPPRSTPRPRRATCSPVSSAASASASRASAR